MLNIYLAGPWAAKARISHIAAQLVGAGHSVPVKWWEHREVPGYLREDLTAEDRAELEEQATLDLVGVAQADVFVLVNCLGSEGKNVEFGYALASGMPIIVIGERSNLFHYCSMVEMVRDVDEALMALDNIVAAWERAVDEDVFADSECANCGSAACVGCD